MPPDSPSQGAPGHCHAPWRNAGRPRLCSWGQASNSSPTFIASSSSIPAGLACQSHAVLELVPSARPAHGAGEPALIAGITGQVIVRLWGGPRQGLHCRLLRWRGHGDSYGGNLSRPVCRRWRAFWLAVRRCPRCSVRICVIVATICQHGETWDMRIPLIVFHGDRDQIVNVVNASTSVRNDLELTERPPQPAT